MIKITEGKVVLFEEEKHYRVKINGKEVIVMTYSKTDEFGSEDNTEIFKGIEQLTKKEQEEVIEYVEEHGGDIC